MTRRSIVSAVATFALLVLPNLARAAAADEIIVLCSNGLKAVVEDLAPKFEAKTQGVWEWKLSRPLAELSRGKLTVSVKDRQGNVTRIERTLSVAGKR